MVYTIGEWAWTAAIWAVAVAAVTVGIALYNKVMDKKERALLKK